MPAEGSKTITEYKGFTITEKYFKQDPYPKKKVRLKADAGWSFGIYGVINRSIHIYTAWTQGAFFKDDMIKLRLSAKELIDEIVSGKKVNEVSVITMPEIKKDEL